MIFYTIYSKDQSEPENSILVKEGFNWYNFFFGIIWSLYKKIWGLSLIHFVILFGTSIALQFHFLDKLIIQVISLFLSIPPYNYISSTFQTSVVSHIHFIFIYPVLNTRVPNVYT